MRLFGKNQEYTNDFSEVEAACEGNIYFSINFMKRL